MSIGTGIVLYTIIWWVVIFAVLPIGVQPSKDKVAGMMPGAPADPQLKRKAIITTLISAVVWLVIFGLIQSDIISFREMAQGM